MSHAELTTAANDRRLARLTRWRPALVALTLSVLVTAVFLPALSNDFVNWDDDIYVTDNPAVSAPDGLRQIWSTTELPKHFPNYPLVFTSFSIEYRLWGLDARGYHATNVALHGLNTALVFLLLQTLGMTWWSAVLTAALFGLHPMQVESVAWVTERKNVLGAFFYLASFLAYLRHRESGRWSWYGAALLAFACALLSKTAMVMLPVSILLAERFRRGHWSAAALGRVAPMFVLGLAAGVLTLRAESQPLSVPLTARPLLAAACLWFYVAKLLVPVGLLPIYPRWEGSLVQLHSWLPLIGVLATIAAVHRWVPEWRARWGLAHFVCMLLPVLGLRPFGFSDYSFVADRHVYVASIGLFVALSIALDRLRRARGRAVTLVACLYLVCMLGLTWKQIAVWRNSVTLWTNVLAGNPAAWFAHNNLGMALIDADRLGDAMRELEAALAAQPDDPDAHQNLAMVFYRQGNFLAAEQHCREALRMRPRSAELHKDLGLTLQAQGQLAAAEGEMRRALELEPDPAYHYLLANVLIGIGRTDEAAQQLEVALQLRPDFASARALLADIRTAPPAGP